MKTLIFIIFTLFATASGEPAEKRLATSNSVTIKGKATYYANKFHGRRTANGEVFSNKKLTAAHLKLPFGTIINVTNVDNGRSVEVRVNDRGPHSRFYIIDLSQAAAKKIGMFGKGVANIEMTYTLPNR